MEEDVIHVVIGESENVYQDKIGESFVPHPRREIVRGFRNLQDAKNFIKKRKLKKPKQHSYGDTEYYKGGYMEMEIETLYIE